MVKIGVPKNRANAAAFRPNQSPPNTESSERAEDETCGYDRAGNLVDRRRSKQADDCDDKPLLRSCPALISPCFGMSKPVSLIYRRNVAYDIIIIGKL